jgi:hypothetical protein
VPIIIASELTKKQQSEFIIKDNVGFGEWDWEQLANEWEVELLSDWGLDLPLMLDLVEPTDDELIRDNKNKPPILKVTFVNVEQLQKAEIEIQELLDRNYVGAYFSISVGDV